jgi:ABC-type multidrug transport system ATPase subunit
VPVTTALRLHRVGKVFEAGFQSCRATVAALTDVDLEVAFGEVVVITGPAASGKTTLLRCVAGILEPSIGSIVRAAPIAFGFPENALSIRKLSYAPCIHVWDHPLSGLTPLSEDELARWLPRLRSAGHAILVSGRSSDRVEAFEARAVILERGRVAGDIPRAAVRGHPREPLAITSPRSIAAAPRTNSRRRSPSDRPTPVSP